MRVRPPDLPCRSPLKMRKAVLGSSLNQRSRFLFACRAAGPRGTACQAGTSPAFPGHLATPGAGASTRGSERQPDSQRPPNALGASRMGLVMMLKSPWVTAVPGPGQPWEGLLTRGLNQVRQVQAGLRCPGSDCSPSGTETVARPPALPVPWEHSPSTSGWRFRRCHRSPPGCHKQSKKAGQSRHGLLGRGLALASLGASGGPGLPVCSILSPLSSGHGGGSLLSVTLTAQSPGAAAPGTAC